MIGRRMRAGGASVGRWRASKLDRDVRRSKADFGGSECRDKGAKGQTLQIGRTYRRSRKFRAHDKRGLQHVDHPLHLKRLDKFGADLRVVEKLLADPLYSLAHRLDIGRGIEMQVELYYRPIAAEIGNR